MSLKNYFLIFSKNDDKKELKEKLLSLEMNLKELKKTLQTLQEQTSPDKAAKHRDPPIIIEKINIEKIILDKYELNNNFGQLGIKELKGKLNIGATYGSEYSPNLEDEESAEEKEKDKKVKMSAAQMGPKVNIKTKQED
ncbi:hypothetical protein [Neobacillus soli]|uniref:hypothetical protein n=1 Tax=Neobacillus soli TaxID=220688 RepID=UPI0008270ADC|nr:hypothetical protein [Neobacillus soli]